MQIHKTISNYLTLDQILDLRSLSMIPRNFCVCWSFVGRFNNLSLLYADLCLSSDKENNYEANELAFITVAV